MQYKSASPKLPVYFMASFLMVVFLGWVTGASTFASLGNASLIALFVTLGVAWEARHRRNAEIAPATDGPADARLRPVEGNHDHPAQI